MSKECKLIHGVSGSTSFLITSLQPCMQVDIRTGRTIISSLSLLCSYQHQHQHQASSLCFLFFTSAWWICALVLLRDWHGVRQDSWKEYSVLVWCGVVWCDVSDLTSDKECKRCQLSYHWHHQVSWDYSKYFISKYLTVLETGESDCHSESAWFLTMFWHLCGVVRNQRKQVLIYGPTTLSSDKCEQKYSFRSPVPTLA